MRLLALNAATFALLAFAFSQAPQVLAQSYDDSAVGRPPQLDGGPAVGSEGGGPTGGSDSRGQTGSSNRRQIRSRPEGTEPSPGTKSKRKPSKRPQNNTRPLPFGGYVEHFSGQRRDHAGMLFQRPAANVLPLSSFATSVATRRPPHDCPSADRINAIGMRFGCGRRCCPDPAPIHF